MFSPDRDVFILLTSYLRIYFKFWLIWRWFNSLTHHYNIVSSGFFGAIRKNRTSLYIYFCSGTFILQQKTRPDKISKPASRNAAAAAPPYRGRLFFAICRFQRNDPRAECKTRERATVRHDITLGFFVESSAYSDVTASMYPYLFSHDVQDKTFRKFSPPNATGRGLTTAQRFSPKTFCRANAA